MRSKPTSSEYIKQVLSDIRDDTSSPWSTFPCLIWPRYKEPTGYGKAWVNGKLCKVHRVAYEFAFGAIPENMDVCHRCDNPGCFRPNHLFCGTAKDNVHDCMEKGRDRKVIGERHHFAKLNSDSVRDIRSNRFPGMSQEAIGLRLGVSQAVISCVIHFKTWRHVII